MKRNKRNVKSQVANNGNQEQTQNRCSTVPNNQR
jgi:hypothetical protein